jgi:hypothetical protein
LRRDRTTIIGETAAAQRMRLVRVFDGVCSSAHGGLCDRQRALVLCSVFSFRGDAHGIGPGTGTASFRRGCRSSPSRAPHGAPARLVDDFKGVPQLAARAHLRQLFVVRHRGMVLEGGRRNRFRFEALRRTSDRRGICRVDGRPRLARILVAIKKRSCHGGLMRGSFTKRAALQARRAATTVAVGAAKRNPRITMRAHAPRSGATYR